MNVDSISCKKKSAMTVSVLRKITFLLLFMYATGHAQKKADSVEINKESKEIKLDGRDGPYIVNDTLYRVDFRNKLVKRKSYSTDSLVVRADNQDANEFHLSLRTEYSIPQSEYALPEKMVVISDIEGKYDAFAGFLYGNGVIDENHNWIYGEGHLVLVGDFVDRGKNVTQVLWLIYKLENQAKLANGQVHFILGNHEILNFQGDHRYNRGKYIKVAQEISGEKDKKEAVKYMFSDKSELGEWLATKNVVEKIGEYLFVHAGFSRDLLEYEIGIQEINDLVRSQFRDSDIQADKKIAFLYGPKGPFWYRGLVMDRLNYGKAKRTELDSILAYYQSKKIVIGHTVVNDISSDYEGKVIRIDVSHGDGKFSEKTKGLLIEDGQEFAIDAKGVKSPISAAHRSK